MKWKKKLSVASVKRKLHVKKYGSDDGDERYLELFGPKGVSSLQSRNISTLQEKRLPAGHARTHSSSKVEGVVQDPAHVYEEIRQIKERNARVEMDKAWETSWERRGVITVVTYIIAALWLVIIKDTNPWLKALVPAAGYFLSTVTIFFMKQWWMRRKFRISTEGEARQGRQNSYFKTTTSFSAQNTKNDVPPPIV